MANCHIAVFVFVLVYFGNVNCCTDSWVEHNSKCYLFSHDTESWIDALNMCKLLGAQLVEIETAEQNTYLQSQASIYARDHFWIALADVNEENTWVWMNSMRKLSETGFSDWYPGQPNNAHADQNCASFYINPQNQSKSWKWNDVGCDTPNHYICEKPAAGSVGTVVG